MSNRFATSKFIAKLLLAQWWAFREVTVVDGDDCVTARSSSRPNGLVIAVQRSYAEWLVSR